MKATFFTSIILAIHIFELYAQPAQFNNASDIFLNKYVHDGTVAYAKIKHNVNEIQTLYDQMGQVDMTNTSKADRKAFYMNAYNIIVIYQVAKYYPLKSPLDKSGFFDKVKHKVAGETMTLNFLEIFKLLQEHKDARIHFGIACAAKSCPPLNNRAFKAENVDDKLQELTLAALNNANFIRVDASNAQVEISKIFDWYKKDFTSEGQSTLDYINRYRKVKIPNTYAVGYYEYNWSLNEDN